LYKSGGIFLIIIHNNKTGLAMIIVLLIVFGIIHAIIADYKGFNPLLWFFAGGSLIGLIVILILPSAKKAEKENPEKSQEIKTSANIAGAIFLVISVISILSFL